jgi:NAD+ kinase
VTLARVGLVVHPTRPIDDPLHAVREWADRRDTELVQVPTSAPQQPVAQAGEAAECDLLLSIGGDGTMLAAIRAGALASRPVLGVACGSLGVLTTVGPEGIASALERVSAGDWVPRSLPALMLVRDSGEELFALNDLAIIRAGEGQVRLSVRVDGTLFAQIVGDGCIVSTPFGSSAYALAAGAPLLTPQTNAFLFTPLPAHGGSCPALVVEAGCMLEIDATPGHGGARLEIDGQVAGAHEGRLAIRLRSDVAQVVSFADQEPFLMGLRRRRIIADSPRIPIEQQRD